jgi:biotin operon repressor
VSSDVEPAAVFAVLDDEYSRAILEAARREPKSGQELSEECDMSRAPVSRRVNELVEAGFLIERTRVDLGGHHVSEYESVLDTIIVRLLEEGFDVTVDGIDSSGA